LENSKDQNGDVVEMKGLYPPLGTVDFYKKGRALKGSLKTLKVCFYYLAHTPSSCFVCKKFEKY
jgi:hypothetical protein